MAKLHNLGFPRIGTKRELKFALEAYWSRNLDVDELDGKARQLRARHWASQSHLDWVPAGDFSLYDQVLDMSFTLGNVPRRVTGLDGSELDAYFRVARGRSPADTDERVVAASEMTKWFDTNYHYIVPEFSADTRFTLNAERLLSQYREARDAGVSAKPVIIGPLSYLWLGKSKDNSDRLALLDRLLPVYGQLLAQLSEAGAEWVQIDEPLLVTDLDANWQAACERAYAKLAGSGAKLLLATYFGRLKGNLSLALRLPVQGLPIDACRAAAEIAAAVAGLPANRILSLGVIDGRNIWKTDLERLLGRLQPLHAKLGDRLWLAPSCSLLHVPVDLETEPDFDPEVRNWLAFARQKLEELGTLGAALNRGRESVGAALTANRAAIASRRRSPRVHNPAVAQALAGATTALAQRQADYGTRAQLQRTRLGLPEFPTTTIGSFPQTATIRQARLQFRKHEIDTDEYRRRMRAEIEHCIHEQDTLGLDVLVHGEAERNDMVEYFGEQLDGYVFSRFGWVQSYGSRCVKPPIIFGDVSRPRPMTVEWSRYAQSLTDKPMKGMLTGPVTMLNWSFVRDDQPRATSCLQIALAIRAEVLDLEQAGVNIIQIDEPALREGLPLRQSEWQGYLDWATHAFRVAANGVANETQIHTHMCYSEFNDILPAIASLDADVITLESSRSDMELLDAFKTFRYPNEIGPGVYDIHSPNIPSVDAMVKLARQAAERIPAERLWINPDCGLKTRNWSEVRPALMNMVKAAQTLRAPA